MLRAQKVAYHAAPAALAELSGRRGPEEGPRLASVRARLVHALVGRGGDTVDQLHVHVAGAQGRDEHRLRVRHQDPDARQPPRHLAPRHLPAKEVAPHLGPLAPLPWPQQPQHAVARARRHRLLPPLAQKGAPRRSDAILPRAIRPARHRGSNQPCVHELTQRRRSPGELAPPVAPREVVVCVLPPVVPPLGERIVPQKAERLRVKRRHPHVPLERLLHPNAPALGERAAHPAGDCPLHDSRFVKGAVQPHIDRRALLALCERAGAGREEFKEATPSSGHLNPSVEAAPGRELCAARQAAPQVATEPPPLAARCLPAVEAPSARRTAHRAQRIDRTPPQARLSTPAVPGCGALPLAPPCDRTPHRTAAEDTLRVSKGQPRGQPPPQLRMQHVAERPPLEPLLVRQLVTPRLPAVPAHAEPAVAEAAAGAARRVHQPREVAPVSEGTLRLGGPEARCALAQQPLLLLEGCGASLPCLERARQRPVAQPVHYRSPNLDPPHHLQCRATPGAHRLAQPRARAEVSECARARRGRCQPERDEGLPSRKRARPLRRSTHKQGISARARTGCSRAPAQSSSPRRGQPRCVCPLAASSA